MRLAICQSDSGRAQARIDWEDSDRSPVELTASFAPARGGPTEIADADGWFLAAAFLADWTGERRITTGFDVCPELAENIRDSLAILRSWQGGVRSPLKLEPGGFRIAAVAAPGRAALLFSAGVDSTWTLFRNRRLYREGDLRRHAVGLMVGGFEVHEDDAMEVAFGHGRVAASVHGLTLIEIRTDIYSAFRAADQHIEFLVSNFEGAFFAALAHMTKPQVGRVDIATTLPLATLAPNGSHPMLRYSGEGLSVRFDGLSHSRLDKLRDLVTEPGAVETLRVCNRVTDACAGRINCGYCNKCVWTMLCLRAAGLRAPYTAFPGAALTPELVAAGFTPRFAVQRHDATAIVRALDAAGETALAEVVCARAAAFAGKG